MGDIKRRDILKIWKVSVTKAVRCLSFRILKKKKKGKFYKSPRSGQRIGCGKKGKTNPGQN